MFLKIKDMAKSELPKERLIQYGKSLFNSELLAILINTGRQGVSSIDIANEMINKVNNLKELKLFPIHDLKIKGIGKAVTLKAAFELGERINKRNSIEK